MFNCNHYYDISMGTRTADAMARPNVIAIDYFGHLSSFQNCALLLQSVSGCCRRGLLRRAGELVFFKTKRHRNRLFGALILFQNCALLLQSVSGCCRRGLLRRAGELVFFKTKRHPNRLFWALILFSNLCFVTTIGFWYIDGRNASQHGVCHIFFQSCALGY